MPGKPRDIARRMADRGDGYRRETFTLPLDEARAQAREFLDRYPAAAYSSGVETWRREPDGRITFTMRRLPTAE
ncbi:MAG: hypothetical protein R3D69_12030 [Xanthobacteraceae bacterium]